MAENNFQGTVEALFKGMDNFMTTKTVVGEPVVVGETVLLPLVDVSFGVAAGAYAENAKSKGGGGMGGKITPSAVLVITKNGTKMINVKNQDTITKLLDLVPDVIDRVKEKKEDKVTEKDIDEMLDKAEEK